MKQNPVPRGSLSPKAAHLAQNTDRRRQARPASRRRRGSALLTVMIMVALVGMTVGSLLNFNINERWQENRVQLYEEELTAAEQAMDSMVGQIRYFKNYKPRQIGGSISNFHNAVLALKPTTVPGYTITASVTCTSGGNLQFTNINNPADLWNGYTMLRVEYKLHTQAKSTSNIGKRFNHPGVALERTIRVQQIPLYAFAIFYDNTLELDAGQRIDIIGRVHTNGNFYLTTSSSAYYHRAITVAGTFFGGYYDPTTGRTGSGSDIYITTDGTSSPSNTTNMASVFGRASDANKFLTNLDILTQSPVTTADYAGWLAEAQTRWNGYLRDSDFGVSKLRLPIPATDDPHQLIEPVNAADPTYLTDIKFANNADVTITGDPTQAASTFVAKDKTGTVIPLSYVKNGTTKWIVSTASIYNGREGKTIKVIDINMANFIESGYSSKLSNSGIIYVQPTQPTGSLATTQESAVRIINSATIPTNNQGTLTLATNAPLYTKGDINTGNNNALLLLAGDAINILSANFTDSYATSAHANSPANATPTTTNAIFLAGNVPSASNAGRYSGGAENFFRYLENWGSGNTHTFNGSLLNLYTSEIATGPWDQNATPGTQSAPYYGAPRRVWSWDPDLAGVTPPAGMPTFFELTVTNWTIAKAT